jgi:hypothetical protein
MKRKILRAVDASGMPRPSRGKRHAQLADSLRISIVIGCSLENLTVGPAWRIGGVLYLQALEEDPAAWLTEARASPGPRKRPV